MKTSPIIIVTLVCLLVFGCSTVEQEQVPPAPAAKPAPSPLRAASRRFVSLRQVQVGMNKKEVAAILGTQIVVGYELIESRTGQYKPLTVNNPFKQETILDASRSYDILYYVTSVQSPDGQPSDEEFVPLVFQADKLIGQGWEFYRKKFNR